MSSKTGERARGGTSGQAAPRVTVSKSRGDKSRSVTLAPLPQVTVDIIPGRFTEEDWLSMVTAEDGEDVVGDLVDSVMKRVMEECLLLHLQKQLIPYTVSQARDALLQMVEWTFVPRDEGDKESDTARTWQEEPHPCPHDSWAQGCVPVTQPPCSPRTAPSQVSSQHPITDIPEQQGEETPPGAEEGPPMSSPIPTLETEAPAPPAPPPIITPTPPTGPPKTRPRYRPHRGPLRSAGLKNITKSLEETEKDMFFNQLVREEHFVDENVNLLPTSLHNILKIQLGRPPQKKDVTYDHAGNVLSVPKVELSRLPRHHVRPRVEVLEVSRESGVANIPRRSQQPLRRSREPDIRGSQGHLCDPPQMVPIPHRSRIERVSAAILLDTMPLTHGVILREGDVTERGSVYSLRQRERRKERRELRPIQPSIPRPSLTIEQLVKNNVPHVQPLVSFMSH